MEYAQSKQEYSEQLCNNSVHENIVAVVERSQVWM